MCRSVPSESKPGNAGSRRAAAGGVEPQRRRAGDDPDRVVGPDRVPVVDALDVVPHPVAVDDARAGVLGDAEHPAVDVGGHAGDHVPGAAPSRSVGQLRADQVVVVADAAGGDDDGRRPELEVADRARGRTRRRGRSSLGRARCRGRRPPRRPRRRARRPGGGSAKAYEPGALGLLHRLDEDPDHLGAGAPGQVEARHRVAVAAGPAVAALGPADERQHREAEVVQVVALLAVPRSRRRPAPTARPAVLAALAHGRTARSPASPAARARRSP